MWSFSYEDFLIREVSGVSGAEKIEWDRYASDSQEATFSHYFFWSETLSATYDLPVFRLAARRRQGEQRLVGILPLMLFAAPHREVRLISLPYGDAAGIAADDQEAGGALLAGALALADHLGAVHVELRQAGTWLSETMFKEIGERWRHSAHTFKTGLRRRLPASAEAMWALLPAKVRNQVRKAERCGCTVAWGGPECLGDFYAVFSENMRDLGSPVHAQGLFATLLSGEPPAARVLVVSCAARPVAAAMVFAHGETLCNPWASSLRRYRPSCPNMLLYWAMLEQAIAGGFHYFDFGRSSPGATTCRFKKQWGAEMEPLTWHVFSRGPHRWDPLSESLVDDAWKGLDLATSLRDGPGRRRWISL